ncbi:ABC transporter ATP-binding protein [Brevibacillus borstelensis]|uniref:ABC transporter ATP-binding protein n=1 Tax=Brevibacillus borstelensis TaxID=45462 RepID=UPI002E1BEEB1|nr:ABC transporter ATP-binding protein [Brevibacillus borstelensis]
MDAELYDLEIDRTPGNVAKTGKRLVRYALLFKWQLLAALLMLAVAVGTDLAGPLIAKRMIDVHISGIEQPWYVTEQQGPYEVSYGGKLYKRADHFSEGEPRGAEARVLQVQQDYYFVGEPVLLDGERTITPEGQLAITKGTETRTYAAQKLETGELYLFFQPEMSGLIQLCVFYFGLLIISAAFSYGERYLLQATANRIIRKMRMDVFAHINKLPIHYFDNLPAGKVVSRITNDTESTRDLYVTVLANFFSGIIYMVGVFAALFMLNSQLAAICLFMVPLLGVWIYVYRRFAKRFNQVIRATVSEINGMINETIQGIAIIKAFRTEKKTLQDFETYNLRHFTYKSKLLSLNAMTGHNLVGVIRNIAFIALIWYFGGISISGVEGVISLGVLYAFVDYLNRLFQPVVRIVNQLPNLETALVSAERVFVLLDEQGEEVSDQKMERYKGHVKFEDVWFAYKDDEYVLKDIAFEAKPGQTVALVGHTGSGKSSILNLLFRFYDVQRGRITIDGVDIKDVPRQTLRDHMGIVLQDPFLFTGTIASNVSLGDDSISREQVEKVLAEVGGERVLKHLPKGIDEPVIEKGSTLSAGQRQMISFARALAFNPAILILDEATSNIDTETEAIIQDALEVVKKGRTTFIIAHRLSTIKNADLILVLDRGEIVERGDHDTLMQLGGKYYQMYQLQQGEQELTAVEAGSLSPRTV